MNEPLASNFRPLITKSGAHCKMSKKRKHCYLDVEAVVNKRKTETGQVLYKVFQKRDTTCVQWLIFSMCRFVGPGTRGPTTHGNRSKTSGISLRFTNSRRSGNCAERTFRVGAKPLHPPAPEHPRRLPRIEAWCLQSFL